MKTSDFFYELPQELIAQEPAEVRDHSRLLVMNRGTGRLEDRIFTELKDYLKPGDCLILNDSRVLPARLYGSKKDTGASVELLLLSPKGGNRWEVLAGPGRRAKPGNILIFGGGILEAEVLDILEDGNRLVEFRFDGNFYNILEKIGEMPLPHYITKKLDDAERYQTVYSREPGSAAAPTAGLHFTPGLLDEIRGMGVDIGFVTLHVGLGTFRPVKVKNIEDHRMHSEHYELPFETAELMNKTRARGGRIIAVGTTSCRTIESVGLCEGKVQPSDGWTSIFIYPGYKFQVIDGLLTNFHLPESTLIMLVAAFAGYEHTMEAYRHAVNQRYRFFSFGDAMLIL
ncbi:MAG: tRNA preQ1(34) S-adenosylmethionine ribosyltransferase-isomerase QueA [Clostridiales bacterium]|jgi:S-adenosylmethionine:tRNA ribosyltransferase-isomerase|nr:tRNA preQ1(34) S-adenosylmethionine ribosyltransferase-isomerase QueA [Clostridiales bacterium]